MTESPIPVDTLLLGDCVKILKGFPEEKIDLVFADPPYNLQLQNHLWRPDMTFVNGVTDEWDKFDTRESYDQFCREWLLECWKVMKEEGLIWVIGSYHNIYRLGRLMMDIGFNIINEVIWVKTNPMPNFRGVRFTNAHETLICASKGERKPSSGRKLDIDEVHFKNAWYLPLCTGRERIKFNGEKVHSTQKPEALLRQVIASSSLPGDVILDPFVGSGTTAVVAKRMERHWIGIDRDARYMRAAQERLEMTDALRMRDKPKHPSCKMMNSSVSLSSLLENGFLCPGETLFWCEDGTISAHVMPDGNLMFGKDIGSLEQISTMIASITCDGWDKWYYQDRYDLCIYPLSKIRQEFIINKGE